MVMTWKCLLISTKKPALLFVDKQLRPAGVGSKAAAAFTLYQEVYIRIFCSLCLLIPYILLLQVGNDSKNICAMQALSSVKDKYFLRS